MRRCDCSIPTCARRWPPSNSVCASDSPIEIALVGLARLNSAEVASPADVDSEMLGSSAARAAATLASAAASCASAAARSGRRVSSSEGKPSADGGNAQLFEVVFCHAEALRHAADQQCERGDGLALGDFERDQCRAHVQHRGGLLRKVELRGDAVAIARVDDLQHALCSGEILAPDVEPLARGEQLKVRRSDAARQRQPHGVGVEAADVYCLLLRLNAGGEPAPQIDLVAHRDRYAGAAARAGIGA